LADVQILCPTTSASRHRTRSRTDQSGNDVAEGGRLAIVTASPDCMKSCDAVSFGAGLLIQTMRALTRCQVAALIFALSWADSHSARRGSSPATR